MLNKKITNHDVKREYAAFKGKARDALSNNKIELATVYLEKAARLMYGYNFIYSDNEIEAMVHELACRIHASIDVDNVHEERAVIVDSFGVSFRGLAWIYCKALIDNNNELLFVVSDSARNSERFKELESFLRANDVAIAYYSELNYTKATRQLVNAIGEFRPGSVFFHGTPWDIAALACIDALPRCVTKYQINLTDHAFWIGSTVFDRCLEFREYGRSISYYERGIPEEKLQCLPYYPAQMIEEEPFQGLPFDATDSYFVSGGSAYKTEGSDVFPSIVETLLDYDGAIKFVFLSNEVPQWLHWLRSKFPERVFHLEERKDLMAVLSKARFYLSTYPNYGGLMTQIAAAAGLVPITLRLDGTEDASKLLPCRDVIIDYDTEKDLLDEAKRLIQDDSYRNMRSEEMRESVMNSSKFAKKLDEAMRGESRFVMPIEPVNDHHLVSLYMKRNNTYQKMGLACLSKRDMKHRTLFRKLTLAGALRYFKERIAWTGF